MTYNETRYRNRFIEDILEYLKQNNMELGGLYKIPDEEFEFLKSNSEMWFENKKVESRGN